MREREVVIEGGGGRGRKQQRKEGVGGRGGGRERGRGAVMRTGEETAAGRAQADSGDPRQV